LTKPPHENGTPLAFFVNNKRKFNNNKRFGFNNFHKGGANASTHEPKIENNKSMVECSIPTRKKTILPQSEKPKVKIVQMGF
jgi:hypothetical protein